MGIFSGWLIASDIDGTLMNNGVIDERSKEKIARFIDEGGIFSLSTGRTPGAVSKVTRQLDRISPSVMGNGTMIYDFNEGRLLYNLTVPEEDKWVIKAVYEELPDLGIEIHSGIDVMALRQSDITVTHQAYEEMTVREVDFEEVLSLPWTKALIGLKSKDDFERVSAITKRGTTHSSLLNTTARIDGVDNYYIEQIPFGTSKASALKELCKILNIKEGRCCAIGDYYNDLEMIKYADISACPLDSPDDIKIHTDFICSKVEDGAVADFIDYIENIIRKETENGR